MNRKISRPWKIEWRYCQSKGFTRWRVWATYKTQESAEKAAAQQAERWKHALGEFRVLRPLSPTDGTERSTTKGQDPHLLPAKEGE